MTALRLAHDRALITNEQRDAFRLKFEHFLRVLNPYIRSIGTSRPSDQ